MFLFSATKEKPQDAWVPTGAQFLLGALGSCCLQGPLQHLLSPIKSPGSRSNDPYLCPQTPWGPATSPGACYKGRETMAGPVWVT